jgi:hypothetical protein
VWKAVKLIVGTSCGVVCIFGPSEVERLAIGEAIGRPWAIGILAVVAIGSYIACFTPRTYSHVTVCSLRLSGASLVCYGLFAGVVKQLVALPTAGIAVAMGLLFLDRAAVIRRNAQENA